MSAVLLVVDDDAALRELVADVFRGEGLELGLEIVGAASGPIGIEKLIAITPDVVVLDVHMPGMDGLEVLEAMKATSPAIPVIMMTGDHDVKSAVRATRLGAFDYLTKPIDRAELVSAVRRALESRASRVQVDGGELAVQLGPSNVARRIVERVKMVAASTFTVLVLGETGTGKELVAQALHRESDRHAAPFVAVDCGAIPEPLLESELFGHRKGAFTGADRSTGGSFQLADHGTLFLDEIGNLPVGLQSKLLRVLESKEVLSVGNARATASDVRFVAASNDDLEARVAAGLFRADLYFRLAQYTIKLPPLRERTGDVEYLASRFLEQASVELRRPVPTILPEAMALLGEQPWPGNVRELRNVMRRVVLCATGPVICKADIRAVLDDNDHVRSGTILTPRPARLAPVTPSAPLAPQVSLKTVATDAARAAERWAICETLSVTHGNKSEAARALHTDYKTLHLKIRTLGIRVADFMK